MRNIQTAVSSHPTENWTHVYMDLFTRNSQYYHLLKYLLFLLKHPVYVCVCIYVCIFMYIQDPPVNRAIWQRRFSIFSVNGEGE